MQTKTVGSLATIKSRVDSLEQVVRSIANQVSVLYIYLNDHHSIPAFLSAFANVIPILGSNSYGDLNANGKMIFLEHETKGIAFTLDDDIIYPPDYVSAFLRAFEDFNHRVCLTVHGSMVPGDASWYYERCWTYAMKDELAKRCAVNLIGSGTCAFPISALDLSSDNFKGAVFVDLQISLAALKQRIPLVAIERQSNWTKPINYEGLWDQFRRSVTHHTHILRSEDCWKPDSLRTIWQDIFDRCRQQGITDPGRHLKLSSETIGFVKGETSLVANDSFSNFNKILSFYDLWGTS
jgi:hypothetical protein